jgi:hypothetical protein
MKRNIQLFGVLFAAALVGMLVAGCEDDNSDGFAVNIANLGGYEADAYRNDGYVLTVPPGGQGVDHSFGVGVGDVISIRRQSTGTQLRNGSYTISDTDTAVFVTVQANGSVDWVIHYNK